MQAIKLPNGNLLVPMRAEGPDGIIGDGMVEVEPGSSEYEEWAPTAVGEHPAWEDSSPTDHRGRMAGDDC